jgi:hypothetical protein
MRRLPRVCDCPDFGKVSMARQARAVKRRSFLGGFAPPLRSFCARHFQAESSGFLQLEFSMHPMLAQKRLWESVT